MILPTINYAIVEVLYRKMHLAPFTIRFFETTSRITHERYISKLVEEHQFI